MSDKPPAEAFYEPLGDGRFASTPATAGPWSPDFQHGGPVSALLGRAFERYEPVSGTRVARVTVELLSPVPVDVLEIGVRIVRPGKRVTLLEAEMTHGGRPVARATAWRIMRAPGRLEPVVHEPPPPPLPATTPPFPKWPGVHADGY
ncbi:MAG TPA: acyl-CoA thioesterase domain-containing protein, partial [Spirillospora sp.]